MIGSAAEIAIGILLVAVGACVDFIHPSPGAEVFAIGFLGAAGLGAGGTLCAAYEFVRRRARI